MADVLVPERYSAPVQVMADVPDDTPQIKVVTIGDPDVGKTSMMISYACNKFMENHVPRVFGTYYSSILVFNSVMKTE